MAPLHSSVHSLEYGRGAAIVPSQSAPIALSLAEVDSRVRYAWKLKKEYELHHVGLNSPRPVLLKCDPQTDVEKYPAQIDAGHGSLSTPNPVIKAEPDMDNNPGPLLKSLYGMEYLMTRQAVKRERNPQYDIKTEPDQDLRMDSNPESPDQNDSSETMITDPGTSGAEQPKSDQVFPTLGGSQPRHGSDGSYLPSREQTPTKTLSTVAHSNHSSRGSVQTYPSPTNVIRLALLKRRQISPNSKRALDFHLSRILRVGVRPLARVATDSPPSPQTPDGNDNLPPYHAFPRTSQLYKSLYGIVQCLRFHTDTSGSSLNASDGSNTPVFNQGGPDDNSTANSDATGAANNSMNDSGQDSNLGADEAIDNIQLSDEDRAWCMTMSQLFAGLANQGIPRTANAGAIQDPIPDSPHMSANGPVPWPTYLNEPDIQGDFQSVWHPSVSGSQIQSQPQSSMSAGPSSQSSAGPSGSQLQTDALSGGQSSFAYHDYHGHMSPGVAPSQPDASLSSYINVNDAPAPSFNDDINQHFHNFPASDSTPGPSTSTNTNPGSSRRPRTCSICGQDFDRPKRLRDHMSKHTGRKENKCKICGKCFSYDSGLSRHFKKEHGKEDGKSGKKGS